MGMIVDGAQVNVLLCTAPAKDAAKLARSIVESELAACVNLLPGVRSIYRWQGEIQDDQECLLIIKSTEPCQSALSDLIAEQHPYTVPEILVLPVTGGLPEYLAWVNEVTHEK